MFNSPEEQSIAYAYDLLLNTIDLSQVKKAVAPESD